MKFNVQFSVGLLVFFTIFEVNAILPLKPGQCSRKCEKSKSFEIIDEQAGASCSCSPSCAKFGDCCYDSSFRKTDQLLKPPTVCLRVENHGLFSAVATCPSNWKETNEFCLESTGHLPPVTSMITGITYTNIFCAVCNGDSLNITIWDVQIKCCSNEESNELQQKKFGENQIDFSFRQNYLWGKTQHGGILSECQCRYQPKSGKSFIQKSTELRPCRHSTISKCAMFWRDKTVRDSCMSYLDPVYVDDDVYRNLHCAECNYVSVHKATCVPEIVISLKRHNMSRNEMMAYCRKNHYNSCLHYFSTSKGDPLGFFNLFAINMKECFPSPDKKCCKGERYDRIRKRCRKIYR